MKGSTVLEQNLAQKTHFNNLATVRLMEWTLHFIYLALQADKGGKDVSRKLLSTLDLSVFVERETFSLRNINRGV